MQPSQTDKSKNGASIKYLPTKKAVELENKAASLLGLFSHTDEILFSPGESWRSQSIPDHVLSEKEIVGPIVEEEPDQSTFEIKRIRIGLGEACFSLDKSGCKLLDDLAEDWSRHPLYLGKTSREAMRKRILRWCIEVLKTKKFKPCVEHIISRLKAEVNNHEVWVKLADIEVQGQFQMGEVNIKGIEHEDIDELARNLERTGAAQKKVSDALNRLRKEWLGQTVASFRAFGDLPSVTERAFENAERACAMLRMIEPGNCSAIQRSYLQPLTMVSQMSARDTLAIPDRGEISNSKSVIDNPPCGIVVDKDRLLKVQSEEHLGNLHNLLIVQNPTQFPKHLINAILIYSRHRLTSDPTEKLIFVFSGLETMLLGGSRSVRRVKQVLKKRFALALTKSNQNQVYLEELVRRAYKLRSEFLHHGVSIDDRRFLQEFFSWTWNFFLCLIRTHQKWTSVSDYCTALDSFAKEQP